MHLPLLPLPPSLQRSFDAFPRYSLLNPIGNFPKETYINFEENNNFYTFFLGPFAPFYAAKTRILRRIEWGDTSGKTIQIAEIFAVTVE